MNIRLKTIPRNNHALDGPNVVSLYDALRERRIDALARMVNAARAAGDIDEARRICQELFAGINARSPAQISRMEQAKPNIREGAFGQTLWLRDRLDIGKLEDYDGPAPPKQLETQNAGQNAATRRGKKNPTP